MNGLWEIALKGVSVMLAGALDVEQTATGIVPRRLPAWTRPQITDPYMRFVVPRPAGVRLLFRTDARTIELDALLTRFQKPYFAQPPVAFDLVIDGDRVISRPVEGGNVCLVAGASVTFASEGAASTVRFDDLGDGWKDLELWLPQAAIVELRALRADGEIEPAAPTGGGRWVHYGSSISHCAEAHSPTRTWPAAVARRAGVDLTSLAFSGCCHLDPFVARTIRDLDASFISLKVGINVLNADSLKLRTFAPALHGFLDTVRDGHPDTPVLVVSPIICPTAEERPGPTVQDQTGRYLAVGDPAPGEVETPSLTLQMMREVIAEVVATRAKTDPRLSYLDGLTLFGAGDAADLYDGLHPNADGYLRIAERFHDAAFGPSGIFAR